MASEPFTTLSTAELAGVISVAVAVVGTMVAAVVALRGILKTARSSGREMGTITATITGIKEDVDHMRGKLDAVAALGPKVESLESQHKMLREDVAQLRRRTTPNGRASNDR